MMLFSSKRLTCRAIAVVALLLMIVCCCLSSPIVAFAVTHYTTNTQMQNLATDLQVPNAKSPAMGVARSPIELLPNYHGEPVVQLLPNHDTDDDVLCFVNADVPPTTTQPAVVLAATGAHKSKKVSLKTCRRSKVKAKEVQVSLRKRGCGRRHLLLHRRMC